MEETVGKKSPPLDAGRTRTYVIYRTCERFSISVDVFYSYNRDRQNHLLAYEMIREQEESKIIELLAGAGAVKKTLNNLGA